MNGKQLKNSILQLAIQGKLVPQDPNDEPASILLQRIRKEKEALVKNGQLKKKDLVSEPITDEEKPFEIPESWEWVRLGSLCSHVVDCPHSTPIKSSVVTNHPCIRTSEIKGGKIIWNSMQYLDDNNYQKRIVRLKPEPGDIVYAREGVYGDAVVLPEGHEFCLGQRTMMMRLIDKEIIPYVHQAIISPFVFGQAKALNREGTTSVGHVNMSDIVTFLIPLPPLAEQHRIVAKIEQLMPLAEEYGCAQEKLDKLNADLPEALRKSILQQAICGKLVPQDPNDEPASVLLHRIRKEKESLVKSGKLKKKDLVTTPITDEEKPFDIPESWEWCRLDEICSFLSRGKSPSYSDVPNDYPVFAQKCNLKDGGISLEQARFLKPETVSKWQEEYHLRTDDVLVNSTGTGTVCRTRLFNEDCLGNYPFTVPDSHVSVVRTFDSICSAYIYHLFNSKEYQDYWEERLAGSTNQKELYIGVLQNTIIPLPPLSEQHRIVAKIEELFSTLK